jgi:hypothetical protein
MQYLSYADVRVFFFCYAPVVVATNFPLTLILDQARPGGCIRMQELALAFSLLFGAKAVAEAISLSGMVKYSYLASMTMNGKM